MNENRISFMRVDPVQRQLFHYSTLSLLILEGLSPTVAMSLTQRSIVHRSSPLTLETALKKPLLSQAPARDRSNFESLAPGGILRPTLRSGSQGAEVTELQAALKLLGYFDGAVDGVFAESTATAVSRFQQAAGLNQDGVVGPATWDRLFPLTPNSTIASPSPTATAAAPKPSSPKPTAPSAGSISPPARETMAEFPILRLGMKGPAVTRLQERLKAVGVFAGTIDGVFGEETQTAVKAAQKNFQLEADGVVGPATWSALMR